MTAPGEPRAGAGGRDRAGGAAGGSPGTCPVCGGRSSILLGGPPAIARCGECGLMALAEFPGKAERVAGYQEEYYRAETGDRFPGVLERLVVAFRRLRVRAVARRVPGPGALLDVGCGRGVLLELLRDRGWRVLGTQLSRTAAEAARRRRGVDVVCGELPDLDLPAGSFDAVTFFHVLEHVDRPDRYLLAARRLLADGGLLVVEVPDLGGPGFRLLGTRHFCVDYPNHLYFFSLETLATLVARCGFRVEEVSRFSLEYSPFTTLQNALNLLPGPPARLYRALMGNDEGRRLRKSPVTWLHAALAAALSLPVFLVSLSALVLPAGNTVRLYCRKGRAEADPT